MEHSHPFTSLSIKSTLQNKKVQAIADMLNSSRLKGRASIKEPNRYLNPRQSFFMVQYQNKQISKLQKEINIENNLIHRIKKKIQNEKNRKEGNVKQTKKRIVWSRNLSRSKISKNKENSKITTAFCTPQFFETDLQFSQNNDTKFSRSQLHFKSRPVSIYKERPKKQNSILEVTGSKPQWSLFQSSSVSRKTVKLY